MVLSSRTRGSKNPRLSKSLALSIKQKGLVDSTARFFASKWDWAKGRYGRNGAIAFLAAQAIAFPLPGSIGIVFALAEALRFVIGPDAPTAAELQAVGVKSISYSKKDSYFGECERDEGGRCISSGRDEEQPKERQRSPDKEKAKKDKRRAAAERQAAEARAENKARAASRGKGKEGTSKTEGFASPKAKEFHGQMSNLIGKSPHISPEQKKAYSEAFGKAMARMPEKAVERIRKAVKGAYFGKSPKDVTNRILERFPDEQRESIKSQVGDKMIACYGTGSKIKGRLFLDGKGEGGGVGTAPELETKGELGIHQIYAHELTHAIDEDGEISNSGEWLEAHAEEIGLDPNEWPEGYPGVKQDTPLSRYAKTNYQEGLAEFGRLMYSGDHDLAAIEKRFPKCAAVAKKHGIWPEGGGKGKKALDGEPNGGPVLEDVFLERVELDKESHTHIDVGQEQSEKSMSWVDPTKGGSLVKPPKQGKKTFQQGQKVRLRSTGETALVVRAVGDMLVVQAKPQGQGDDGIREWKENEVEEIEWGQKATKANQARDALLKTKSIQQGKKTLRVGEEYHIVDSSGKPIANVSVLGDDYVAINRIEDGSQIKRTTIAKAEAGAMQAGHSFKRGHVSQKSIQQGFKAARRGPWDMEEARRRESMELGEPKYEVGQDVSVGQEEGSVVGVIRGKPFKYIVKIPGGRIEVEEPDLIQSLLRQFLKEKGLADQKGMILSTMNQATDALRAFKSLSHHRYMMHELVQDFRRFLDKLRMYGLRVPSLSDEQIARSLEQAINEAERQEFGGGRKSQTPKSFGVWESRGSKKSVKDVLKKRLSSVGKGLHVRADIHAGVTADMKDISLPEITQSESWSCGAALVAAVAKHFGIEPNTEAEAIQALGSSPSDGTTPDAIIRVLEANGLATESRDWMPLEELEKHVAAGLPVLVPVQMYGYPKEYEEAEGGHWVAVVGFGGGEVRLHDPVSGSVEMKQEDFEKRWYDKEADGTPYERYGIAVSKGNGSGEKGLAYQIKGEGTCAVGERADLTGCTPASPDAAGSEPKTDDELEEKPKEGKKKPKLMRHGADGGKEVSEEEAKQYIKDLLGENVDIDFQSLVGAPEDAEIEVTFTDKFTSSSTGNTTAMAIIKVNHKDYEASRSIINRNGKKIMVNDHFYMKPNAQGKGLGSEVFSKQVEECTKNGFSEIRCHAAKLDSDGKPKYNGYYTWPRFGYDQSMASIKSEDKKLHSKIVTAFPKAKSILDVMKTKKGRDWWKENGGDLQEMSFDLSPGSRSMKILKAYQEERKQRAAA